MGDWIKCSDRLPEPNDRVMGAWGNMVGEAYLKQSGKWYRFETDIFLWTGKQVTHWMTLPEPPEKNSEAKL